MVPTMARTMLYKNPSAHTRLSIRSPRRSTLKIVHRAHGGPGLGAHGADGPEVVGAHKLVRRPLHDVLVQALGIEPGPVHIEGVAQAGVIDTVGILLPVAGADGVEAPGEPLWPAPPRCPWAGGCSPPGECGRRGWWRWCGSWPHRSPHGHGHRCRPAPVHFTGWHTTVARCLFQGLRHGDGVLLHLPAVVGRAVIHQFQGDIPFHSPS